MFADNSIEVVYLLTVELCLRGASAREIADLLVGDDAVQQIFRAEYAKRLRRFGLPVEDSAAGIGIVYQYCLSVRWERFEDQGPQKFRGYLVRLARCASHRELRKMIRQRRAERTLVLAAMRASLSAIDPHAVGHTLEELLLCASTAPNRLRQFMILMVLTGRVETSARLMRLSTKTVKRYQRAAWAHFQNWLRQRS